MNDGRVCGLRLFAVTCSALIVLFSAIEHANAATADFPLRPIRLISPFAPGGGNDIISRTIGLAVGRDLGQSVVVDNRPGANTIIGMEMVAKSAADGYTLIMTSSTQAINATLYRQLPYDSVRDFSPVCLVGASPLIVAVPVSSPIRNIVELIAAAKARPGELTFPSAGTGNATHLAGELFGSMAGITLVHVPYKGSVPGLNDLIAGRMAVVFSPSASVLPFIRSGKLRALAVTSSKRSSVMPELQTVAESGLPAYEASTWYGILAPAGTPRAVVARLNAAIVKALELTEVRERFAAQAVDPVGSTPQDFSAYVKSEIVKWAAIIKTSGVKPE